MDPEFIKATASLARAAPQEWARFIEHLKYFTAGIRDECIRAPADMVQNAQGRARIMTKFTQDLENIVKLDDEMPRRQ